MIKNRNGKDLTGAKEIKKMWQECTEIYILKKKVLHDPDNYDGVVSHLEPDILECEVKWALGSITINKASGGDEIPAELFQILKDDAVKVLHSICQQIWKTQQWPRTRKGQFSFQTLRRAMSKNVQTAIQLQSFNTLLGFTVLESRTSRCTAGSRKGRETRNHIASIYWIIEKAWQFQKNIYFCFIEYVKVFDHIDHNRLWKIKEMRIPDHLICFLRNLYAGQKAIVRTGHGTTDWFQIGKGVHQGCILSPCLFNLYICRVHYVKCWAG